MKINWNKTELFKVVNESKNKKEVLKKLGIRAAGGNFKTLKKYLKLYEISTDHFEKNYESIVQLSKQKRKENSEILIENSNFSRYHLKKRLLSEKIIDNKCILCGQDENWNGMKISLILDHINGIYNDNRIENLRIVCPNCNAGLDTFAGKNIKQSPKEYFCECGCIKNKYSISCKKCNGDKRQRVKRPTYEKLKEEIEKLGYVGTGKKYGVSDNAIRKWINKYCEMVYPY
jgi:hypothetical protein